MKNRFPTVGIIGAGEMARMSAAPAAALGIELLLFTSSSQESAAQVSRHIVGDYRNLKELLEFAHQCDVITVDHTLIPNSVIKSLEATGVKVFPTSHSLQYSQNKTSMLSKLASQPSPKWKMAEEFENFDSEIVVMVARSQHGQATSWAPTQTVYKDGVFTSTITPASEISGDLCANAQHLALLLASEVSLIGVMAVEMSVVGEEIFIKNLVMRPHGAGNWTIEGSLTSQFEQQLRAILDLPLGDPAMTAQMTVTGNIYGADKTDMYRPYLHLMARNPELKFHQYGNEVIQGSKVGHVTVTGKSLSDLIEIIEHARDYMSGSIDE